MSDDNWDLSSEGESPGEAGDDSATAFGGSGELPGWQRLPDGSFVRLELAETLDNESLEDLTRKTEPLLVLVAKLLKTGAFAEDDGTAEDVRRTVESFGYEIRPASGRAPSPTVVVGLATRLGQYVDQAVIEGEFPSATEGGFKARVDELNGGISPEESQFTEYEIRQVPREARRIIEATEDRLSRDNWYRMLQRGSVAVLGSGVVVSVFADQTNRFGLAAIVAALLSVVVGIVALLASYRREGRE